MLTRWEQMERTLVRQAMTLNGGSQKRAAQWLGISRTTFGDRYRRYFRNGGSGAAAPGSGGFGAAAPDMPRPAPKRLAETTSVTRLLAFFGVAIQPGRRRDGNFWQRHEHDLAAFLKAARRSYLLKCKTAHPDAGGSEEAFTELNATWTRLKTMFARHGHTLN